MRPAQRGVTMLEVLVTLLIITLFLLASAGIQSSAARVTKAAEYRTEAVLLATEISERMEANAVEAAYGTYDCGGSCTLDTVPSTCVGATCDSAALAAFDLAEWGNRLAATLPGASANIAWNCVSGCTTDRPPPAAVLGTYTVTIGWTDRRSKVAYSTDATTEAFQYQMTRSVYYNPG